RRRTVLHPVAPGGWGAWQRRACDPSGTTGGCSPLDLPLRTVREGTRPAGSSEWKAAGGEAIGKVVRAGPVGRARLHRIPDGDGERLHLLAENGGDHGSDQQGLVVLADDADPQLVR